MGDAVKGTFSGVKRIPARDLFDLSSGKKRRKKGQRNPGLVALNAGVSLAENPTAGGGGFSLTWVSKNHSNTPYSSAVGEGVYWDTTSGSCTQTLPSAPPNGTIAAARMDVQGSVNTVTINRGGSDTFEAGATSQTIQLLKKGFVWEYQSGVWYEISESMTLASLDARYAQLSVYDPAAIAQQVVGTTATQTLTNKTLTSPIISSISNTGTVTLPTATDTLVARATTDTLTNKRITKRVLSSASTAGLTVNTDTYDAVKVTGLAVGLAVATSGTPNDFDMIAFRIYDNGSAQTLNFQSTYFYEDGVALPTTTPGSTSKSVKALFQWDAAVGKWGCISATTTF